MIYYLTGTGNSRWAAQLLADHLHDTAEDAAPAGCPAVSSGSSVPL